jgi:hypothetical protein
MRASQPDRCRGGWRRRDVGDDTAAAIGNAVFDATGVRLREVPFTPERLKRALEKRAK